jgi:metal-responsive CopG/Arc/MetJ family transcriptional regulator
MKAVQFTVDEALLKQIDRDPEARKLGRSAFIRRAVTAYLRGKEARAIDEQYREAYARQPVKADEFAIEQDGMVWPDE